MSYLNGIFSSWTTSPSVFLPTLITLLTGAFVSVNSPDSVFVTLPSSIVKVVVLVFSPAAPSTSTLCSPGARVSSNSTIVSNGTSTFSSILWVPSRTPSPTWIRASCFSFKVFSVVCDLSTTESFITRLTSFDPNSPVFITLISPFLSEGSFSTLVSKGMSTVYLCLHSVPDPINWT